LARRVALGFELVGELIELVEIDPGPEPECVRNGLRCRVPTWPCLLAETSAERPVDHVLKRQPELSRAPLGLRAYSCVSCLNRRHMVWAWTSLFTVGFSDLYVRLCSMGVWSDVRIF